MRRSEMTAFVFAATALAGSLTTRPAAACGGTFCDTGPRAMPVDQTGENIVFVMEPGKVEAHIQIQYKGEPDKFSWVLPVQAMPAFEVGSQALFDRLLASTVPTYGYTTQRTCAPPPNAGGGGSGGSGFGGGADAATSADGGVGIVFQKTVGAFDVTVLAGGTTTEVLDWLKTNGYQTPANAPALFEDYVAKSYFFVAVKLTGGAGLDEIHPLVVRYDGTEPCVPLKLTAVAAVENMGVRTFFLGTKRVVPTNYKHVVPNPARLDWLAFGANYKDWVGRAADSPIANGQAFVTEYAGPAAVAGGVPFASPKWDPTAFAAIAPVDVMTRLQTQGLAQCNQVSGTCTYAHPLLLPILRQFLPAPASLTLSSEAGVGSTITDPVAVEGYFYSCTSCYKDLIDMSRWNANDFRSMFTARIVEPARHADALLATWPYLTRLFTTISPAEMTADPEFKEVGTQATVRAGGSATRRIACTNTGFVLPDGREVALTPLSAWPGFASDMPWAERIEEFGANGDPIVLVDNKKQIDDVLKAWNDSRDWPGGNGGAGGGLGTSDASVPTGSGGADPSGTSGAAGTTGSPDAAGTSSTSGQGGANGADPGPGVATNGCGCRTSPAHSPFAIPGALAAALAALLRVRDRRSRAAR